MTVACPGLAPGMAKDDANKLQGCISHVFLPSALEKMADPNQY